MSEGLCTMFCKIFGDTFRGRLHGIFAGPPVCRTDIAVFFKKLQRIDNPQCFVNISAEGQIVYQLVPDDSIPVYQKKAAQGDAVL